jgi:hypothetical protein
MNLLVVAREHFSQVEPECRSLSFSGLFVCSRALFLCCGVLSVRSRADDKGTSCNYKPEDRGNPRSLLQSVGCLLKEKQLDHFLAPF